MVQPADWFMPQALPHPPSGSPALDRIGAGISIAANQSPQSSWTDNSKSASFNWLTNAARVPGEGCSVIESRSHSPGYNSWHLLNRVFPGINMCSINICINMCSINICCLIDCQVYYMYTLQICIPKQRNFLKMKSSAKVQITLVSWKHRHRAIREMNPWKAELSNVLKCINK